jgi:glycosyltransferase involved in cell wall biosynthesis
VIPKFATRQLDWEVIIVDDASPDGTQDIAKQLTKVYGEDKIVGFYFSCYCQSLMKPIGSEAACWKTWFRVCFVISE